MAIATYQALAPIFVNGAIVGSGNTFTANDATFVIPRKPVNNHHDPAKVTHTDLAVKQ